MESGRFFVGNNPNLKVKSCQFLDEAERKQIYEWSQQRNKYTSSIWYRIRIYLIDWKLLISFIHGFSVVVIANLGLTLTMTYLCSRYNFKYFIHPTLLMSPIIFPLTFLINSDFHRRELSLERLAEFKSQLYSVFINCRELGYYMNKKTNIDHIYNLCQQILFHLTEYLSTLKLERRIIISKIIYEDMSDLNQLIYYYAEESKDSPGIFPIIARIVFHNSQLCLYFEKLRILREYRTPFTTRAFTKVMTFILPILFSPLYVQIAYDSNKKLEKQWLQYIIAFVVSFSFGALQSVQDRLYDPFTGISCDAVDLSNLMTWAEISLLHTAKRNYKSKKFENDLNSPNNDDNSNEDCRRNTCYHISLQNDKFSSMLRVNVLKSNYNSLHTLSPIHESNHKNIVISKTNDI